MAPATKIAAHNSVTDLPGFWCSSHLLCLLNWTKTKGSFCSTLSFCCSLTVKMLYFCDVFYHALYQSRIVFLEVVWRLGIQHIIKNDDKSHSHPVALPSFASYGPWYALAIPYQYVFRKTTSHRFQWQSIIIQIVHAQLKLSSYRYHIKILLAVSTQFRK